MHRIFNVCVTNHGLFKLAALIPLFSLINCQYSSDNGLSKRAHFEYSHGDYAGRLTLFGDSIWSNGDYILIVQKFDQNDTIVGSYTIENLQTRLVGTAISGYPGILFSVYPGLDSGYLFDEPTIILRSIVN